MFTTEGLYWEKSRDHLSLFWGLFLSKYAANHSTGFSGLQKGQDGSILDEKGLMWYRYENPQQ